jgi:hypothetical protein
MRNLREYWTKHISSRKYGLKIALSIGKGKLGQRKKVR